MSAETEFRRIVGSAQVQQRLPAISAAVFRDGEPLWQEALGLANVDRDEPATVDHRYRIGSITKTFTAVAVMQLQEDGALALEAPIRTVVPEFQPGPTFAQALAHLTGIQREPAGEIWETMDAPDREQLLAGLEDAEQVLAPGESWHYSNLAFAVLGEAVVRLSGSYERHLEERILAPLGLHHTALRATEPAATPYYIHPWTQVAHVEPSFDASESTAAAGWLWSTTGDLARWGDFLCTGHDDVLPRAVVDRMCRLETMVDSRSWTRGWGLGLELARLGDRVLVGHGGAMPGFLAALYVDRADRTGAVVLTNTTAAASPKTIALDLITAALDYAPRAPSQWRPSPPPPTELEQLLGQWWTEGDELAITWDAPRLRIDVIRGPAGTTSWLERAGDDCWRVSEGRERGELVRVVRDEHGAPVKLYFATYPVTRAPLSFGAEVDATPRPS